MFASAPHAPLLGLLRTVLAGRYTVEQELGRGGMAVVFLGRDLRLERRVAIKVFEHEGQGGPAIERFLREVRVAAHLQHPNILPVFESGEAEGLTGYERIAARWLGPLSVVAEKLFMERAFRGIWARGWRRLRAARSDSAPTDTD